MTTISLSLARQISELAKEKGIELPESYFVWKQAPGAYMDGEHYFLFNNFAYLHLEIEPPRPERVDGEKIIRAYTADELMEMLPFSINFGSQDDYYLMFERFEHSYSCTYASQDLTMYDKNGLAINFEADTPAEALGQLLLWTMDQGYIEVAK